MNNFSLELNRYRQNIRTVLKNHFLLPRIVRTYLTHFVLGKNTIRQVEIAIGYECNARCEQCSCHLSLDRNRQRLTLPEFKRLVDESIAIGAFQFNLTGGEPLLHLSDTQALISYIHQKKCYVHLCSNGLLLNKDLIYQLKAAGLNSIEFGLDSAQQKVHDQNRCPGAFQAVMEATTIAKGAGLEVIWDTIITPARVRNGDLRAVIDLAKEKGALVQITPPCVVGKWSNKKGIALGKIEKEYFADLLTLPHVRTDTFSSLLKPGCPAGREKLAVNPYGDVLPCSLVQIAYGNFLKESLSTIQARMLAEPYYVGRGGLFSCLPSFNPTFIKMFLKRQKGNEKR